MAPVSAPVLRFRVTVEGEFCPAGPYPLIPHLTDGEPGIDVGRLAHEQRRAIEEDPIGFLEDNIGDAIVRVSVTA